MALSFLQVAKDSTDLITYTFSTQSLGSAAADRFIICAVTGRASDGGARTISSVTIGGVSATINAQVDTSGTSTGIVCAAVPSGTTGDVVVTWSDTMTDANIALYRCTGLSSATALATATSAADPGVGTVIIKTGGIIIGIATDDDGSHTCTWTGLTENYDEGTGQGRDWTGAMVETSTSSSVSVSTNLAVTADWNAASTRPTTVICSFQITETLSPLSLVGSVQAPSVVGTANVSPAVISLVSSIIAPTISLVANDWTNQTKNTGSWSNQNKS